MVGRLEAQAREWAAQIVEHARELGTVNFVQDVAYQLPMHMIADIVGIPVEDRPWLFGLTNQLLQGASAATDSSDGLLAVQVQMFEYAQELGRRKRAEPQDDVWTILSTVEIETDTGERTGLAETELDMFFFLLTVAGSETTRSAITGGLTALLEHPDQMEHLRRDPEVMRPAVDEILRWSSPVAYFARRATRDTDLRGVSIASGDRVTMWYPSANRDESAFEHPFRFDITRTPNNHVAFGGGGPHHCLGANLAATRDRDHVRGTSPPHTRDRNHRAPNPQRPHHRQPRGRLHQRPTSPDEMTLDGKRPPAPCHSSTIKQHASEVFNLDASRDQADQKKYTHNGRRDNRYDWRPTELRLKFVKMDTSGYGVGRDTDDLPARLALAAGSSSSGCVPRCCVRS